MVFSSPLLCPLFMFSRAVGGNTDAADMPSLIMRMHDKVFLKYARAYRSCFAGPSVVPGCSDKIRVS
jgi:hypothetical protein